MSIVVRPLRATDLDDADRIFRLAFGTFVGLPDPLAFAGDSDWVRTRFRTDPDGALAAEVDGRFAGSNFVCTWGSVGFFGPLSVRPDLWNAGVAKRLLAPTVDLLAARGTRLRGLFTFAHSPKHVGLYQRFGFWPRFLTAVMERPVDTDGPEAAWSTADASTAGTLARCRELTEAVCPGLDLGREIASVAAQGIGDTVLLGDGAELEGLAVCHTGAGSEAGSGVCYAKFAAVRPGPGAAARFERLLDACMAFARGRGLRTLTAGVNTARHDAYRHLLARGFRTAIQGVLMTRDGDPGLGRPDCWVLDDWR